MHENYEKLKKFFMQDLEIKRIMYDMQPPLKNEIINEEYLVKYTDKTYAELKYIIDAFKEIIICFGLNFLNQKLEILSDQWIKIFINCKTHRGRLETFYKFYVTTMNDDLIDSVKEECVGYTGSRAPQKSVKMIQSINEMLHVIHSYIMNNEKIYESANELANKNLSNDYPVRLYGEENVYFQKIFDNFPIDLDCGWTEIVSFGNLNKAIMMIRDRGHALTIEIDIDDYGVRVNYFIPKLCNIDMINSLPGVNKVKEYNHNGTTGMFMTNTENLCNDLFRFIEMVPTDFDMPNIRDYLESRKKSK